MVSVLFLSIFIPVGVGFVTVTKVVCVSLVLDVVKDGMSTIVFLLPGIGVFEVRMACVVMAIVDGTMLFIVVPPCVCVLLVATIDVWTGLTDLPVEGCTADVLESVVSAVCEVLIGFVGGILVVDSTDTVVCSLGGVTVSVGWLDVNDTRDTSVAAEVTLSVLIVTVNSFRDVKGSDVSGTVDVGVICVDIVDSSSTARNVDVIGGRLVSVGFVTGLAVVASVFAVVVFIAFIIIKD